MRTTTLTNYVLVVLMLLSATCLTAQVYPGSTSPASGSTLVVGSTVTINFNADIPIGCFAGCVSNLEVFLGGNCGSFLIQFDGSGNPTQTGPYLQGNCNASVVSATTSFRSAAAQITVAYSAAGTYVTEGQAYAAACCDGSGGLITSYSGHTTLATYTIIVPNSAPSTVSVTGIPTNINYGTWVTVTSTVRDPNGWSDINYFHLLVSYGVDGSLGCFLVYYNGNNQMGLLNDPQNSWQNSASTVPGTAGQFIGGGNCSLDVGSSSISRSGTDVVLSWRLMFKPPMLAHPPLNAYLYVIDNANAAAGWNGPYATGNLRPGPKLIVTSQH